MAMMTIRFEHTPRTLSTCLLGGHRYRLARAASGLHLRLFASWLTTYWCDDFAPTCAARGCLPARSLFKLDGARVVSPAPHSELVTARRTYSVEEAAVILGISRTTAYECVKSKELPALRFRGRIVISAAVIDALLADQPTH